ncbi:hypothetical protein [Ligilactobacillus salivarius]|uniref:hypothetical protein n=1 Tax=Ligilactobacillus salivarius TaxID=1624 RepID=UPI0022DEC5C3|nr:hypothetical protein [Ligilactobacillus salivarius]
MARFKIVRLIQKISNLMLALIVLNERNIKYEVPKNDKESIRNDYKRIGKDIYRTLKR